jgi:basic membrane lipoprotein Med (substrate-binding protein (PBP1-ABC) superfamily)
VNLNNLTRKAQEFLKTEKGEEVSDKLLDGGAAVANKVTGNKHADKIQNARDSADKHVGRDEDAGDRGSGPSAI